MENKIIHVHRNAVGISNHIPSSLYSLLRTAVLRFKHAVAVADSMKCSPKSGANVASTNVKPRTEPKKKAKILVEGETINRRKKLEKQWLSSKDVNSKVGLLLQMASAATETKFLFPRQMQILPLCVAFWTKNFPHCNKALSTEAAKDLSSPNLSNPDSFSLLSRTLTSIYGTNCKFAAIADVSVAAGEVEQFLRLCRNLRRESKTYKGLNTGTLLLEPAIHETLARHFAAKADWANLNGILRCLQQDGLPVSKKLYLFCLECLGRLLKNATRVILTPSRTPFSPATATSLTKVVVAQNTAAQRDLERRITEVLIKLINRMEEEGHDVTTDLVDLPREQDTLSHILYALNRARPNLQPNLFYLPEMMSAQNSSTKHVRIAEEKSYPVEQHVRSVPHAMRNALTSMFSSLDEMMQAFEAQFSLERQGEVRIQPVLPPFSITDSGALGTSESKSISPRLRKKLLRGLMAEQDRWRAAIRTGFMELLQRLKRAHSRDKVTVYPFLKILPASQYVDLMIKAVDNMVLDSALQHVNSYLVCLQLGESVEAACSLYRRDQLGMFTELKHVYRDYVQMFNEECMKLPQFRHMWLHALDKRVHEGVSLNPEFPDWPASVHFLVGRALYSLIYDRVRFNRNEPVRIRQTTTVSSSSKEQAQQRFHSDSAAPRSEEAPALFEVCTEYPGELRNEVKIHPALLNWYRDANYPPLSFHPAELPMLCPPVPWTSTKDAGYLMSRNYATRLIRHSNNYPESIPVLNDDLDFDSKRIPAIFDALNCLASCPWRVNEPILDGLIEVARAGGSRKLGVPERVSRNPSESLCITKSMSYEERRRARRASREAWLRFNEARSLWANELYRLSIANQYRGRVFWFPHSMDFRGRVYPCPPHFHHMGSDISRGLIVFAKGMPLGPKGLDWLKIHLVNLTGLKKRCSNNERLEFANTILDDVLDSAINPFEGRKWWQEQEEPWQTLACCQEILRALNHEGGPESFISHFPVHQDGSCNGLQHYAALGRDRRGAESVNLTNKDCPQDVYGDVVEVVEAQRREDAAAGVPVAQILENFVRRKVIKQSVMTTVYGVTLYGASEQIRKQLRDLNDFPGRDWIGPAASYLARSTLTSIGRIFTSSAEIQAWFGQLAQHISGQLLSRVSWETPMGLPVTQPYIRLSGSTLYSSDADDHPGVPDLSSKVTLPIHTRDFSQSISQLDVPVPNPIKQKNAFPPNFIHSLDSCHMMLTALHCLKAGITFASVHDCFWTHAATVDVMNEICREEFIALHSEPILQNFADYLRQRFAYSQSEIANMTSETRRARAMAFNQLLSHVPKQGLFDLSEVRNSTYFFS